MLKNLQRKFILTNMILVGIVLIIVFTVVCVNTYKTQLEEVYRNLSQSIRHAEKNQNEILNFGLEENGNKSGVTNEPFNTGATVTVTLSPSGSIVDKYENMGTMTEEVLDSATKIAFKSNIIKGHISNLNLYYLKVETTDYIFISFANSYIVERILSKTIMISILLGFLTMLVFFAISLLLAKMSIRPVRKAWIQQQQFVADASHELKTPLTVILANNNILLSQKKAVIDEQLQWVQSSQDEAAHMKKLIDNLLFLARSDASENKLTFSTIPLSDVFLDCTLQFDPIAFEKNIIINTDIKNGLTLNGDETQIRQLMHILLDNACKYTKSGGTINAKLHKVGNVIQLVVQNSGDPIPKEDIPHLFERFYRSDKVRTIKNGEGGYGLGLAIAKSIVESHHGKIHVTSTKTSGTTFNIELK